MNHKMAVFDAIPSSTSRAWVLHIGHLGASVLFEVCRCYLVCSLCSPTSTNQISTTELTITNKSMKKHTQKPD